ncbi:MAG: non-canonical purine NTP pyrophosphatase [Gemmatimonadota bacterium]
MATRSRHKLRELWELLPATLDLDLLDLAAAGVEPDPGEEDLEAFATFQENALAKARYFSSRSRRAVLADDSGLAVDALGGRPGVHSKRFSGRTDLGGLELDLANNQHLLAALADTRPEDRTAHYVCAIAVVTPGGREDVFRGTVHGKILERPHGEGGFGYDPLFFVPGLHATFAQVTPAEKNRISHRARALQAASPRLHELAAAR